MLNSLLHITVNGPDTGDCRYVIQEALKKLLSKRRRKIAKYTDKQKEVTKVVKVEASVQVGSQPEINSASEEPEDDLTSIEDTTNIAGVESTASTLKLLCLSASDGDSQNSHFNCYTASDLE